jgi:hypothetical protein
MSDRSISFDVSRVAGSSDSRFPLWFCAAVILGVSAAFYYLAFELISAL